MDVREWVAEYNEEALMADGLEDAILGVCSRIGMNTVVAYDRAKCIEVLMAQEDWDFDEAEEFFSFNTERAWVGDNTPVFVALYKDRLEV